MADMWRPQHCCCGFSDPGLWLAMKAYMASNVGNLFSSFSMSTVAIVMNKMHIVLGYDQAHGGSFLLCIFLANGY